MLVTDGIEIREVTDKAYNVIYKVQGYKPVEDVQEVVKVEKPARKTKKKDGE